MHTATTRRRLRALTEAWRRDGLEWAFVPTMGALHDGHLALVRAALAEFPRVVASVFVNPTQFDRADDLARYPRQPARDAELLAGAGAHALFLPSVEEVYPDPAAPAPPTPDLGGLGDRYEGAARPGHFDGVVQVVRLLVEAVRPAAMYMGQKDAQQVAVLRAAARAEAWPVDIRTVGIVREPSGLAMSSRNGQLTPAGFARAAHINAQLDRAERRWRGGEPPRVIEADARGALAAAGFRVEYFDLVDARDFTPLPDAARAAATPPGAPPTEAGPEPLIVAVAWLEGVRLIDNRPLG